MSLQRKRSNSFHSRASSSNKSVHSSKVSKPKSKSKSPRKPNRKQQTLSKATPHKQDNPTPQITLFNNCNCKGWQQITAYVQGNNSITKQIAAPNGLDYDTDYNSGQETSLSPTNSQYYFDDNDSKLETHSKVNANDTEKDNAKVESEKIVENEQQNTNDNDFEMNESNDMEGTDSEEYPVYSSFGTQFRQLRQQKRKSTDLIADGYNTVKSIHTD